MTALAEWQNFYVIVGSSAGALIGLQFVVLSLINPTLPARGGAEAGDAFGTPTIVHFGAVLALSAIASAPWKGLRSAMFLWGVGGLCGVVYAAIVLRRMRRQTQYRPQFEDWVFHLVVPLMAYLLLAGAAYAAYFRPHEALFGVGGAALLLLFSGIHNAWDAVTYHVFYLGRHKAAGDKNH